MSDRATFEVRLGAAYGRLVEAAPTTVDARAMAAAAATAPRVSQAPWASWSARGAGRRLVLVALALSLTVVGAAIVGSSRPALPTPTPAPSATDATPTPVPTAVAATIPPVLMEYEGIFRAVAGPPPDLRGSERFVQLHDGRVLGLGNSWPELRQQVLWSPATLQFSPAGVPSGKRQQPEAVVLADGRVLVIGGDITEPVVVDGGLQGSATYSTAEIYDPATGRFAPTGMPVARSWAPTAVLLHDGRVLVLDGISVDRADTEHPELDTAQLYDPATHTFSATGSMGQARGPSAAVVMGDGRVFVIGGNFPESGIADVFDPATETFAQVGPLPDPGPRPAFGQYWPTVANHAVLLRDGRVLVAGRACDEIYSTTPNGESEGWYPTAASIFDPSTDTFTAIEPMPHCVERAIGLPNGEVLLTSFWNGGTATWSGLWDPDTHEIRETARPSFGRYVEALGLADGRVLFVTDGVALFQ